MELSDLKVFLTVAEEGGISRAANVLHRVPSNITARIQKLESELNQELFIREKNRLKISSSGEQLLDYAKRILSLANQALEELNNEEPTGVLKVGCMEAVAASRLSPVLVDYHKRHPEVELEITTSPTGLLIDKILSGELDLALVADPAEDDRLVSFPIFKERLVMVSSVAQGEVTHPDQLGTSPTMLGFSSQCAYRNRLNQWLQQGQGLAKVLEINSYHTLLNCVTAGMGVGLVPEKLLELYPFKEGLNTHQLPEDISHSVTHAIWRKDNQRPSIQAFYEVLSAVSNLN